ncbi:hypothetical protein ACFLZP_00790 [Patescibacteria group bacterium]
MLCACQPQTVIVEKEVEVTKIVAGTPVIEKVVETQVIEVEREVTRKVEGGTIIEKVIETRVVEKPVEVSREVTREVTRIVTPTRTPKPDLNTMYDQKTFYVKIVHWEVSDDLLYVTFIHNGHWEEADSHCEPMSNVPSETYEHRVIEAFKRASIDTISHCQCVYSFDTKYGWFVAFNQITTGELVSVYRFWPEDLPRPKTDPLVQ